MNTSFVPSTHQAAGHDGCLISPDNGTVFAKLTNQQEIDFYHQTQILDEGSVDNSPLGSHLSDWMPVYMGTLTKGDITNVVPNSFVLDQPPLPHLSRIEPIQSFPPSKSIGEAIGRAVGSAGSAGSVTSVRSVGSAISSNTPVTSEEQKYIVLQNLYHGFSKPSILDIKLGKVLYDETASPEKKQRLTDVSNSTTSGSLGFRICGMKCYHSLIERPSSTIDLPSIFPGINETITVVPELSTQTVYLEVDKQFGRSLDISNVKEGLLFFFKSTQLSKELVLKLVQNFKLRLQVLYNCLLDSSTKMISSSLLFIYENDSAKWAKVESSPEHYHAFDPLLRDDFLDSGSEDEMDYDDDDTEGYIDKSNDSTTRYKAPLSSLNIIDFAHSKYVDFPYDENVVEGFLNLINIFEEMENDLQLAL